MKVGPQQLLIIAVFLMAVCGSVRLLKDRTSQRERMVQAMNRATTRLGSTHAKLPAAPATAQINIPAAEAVVNAAAVSSAGKYAHLPPIDVPDLKDADLFLGCDWKVPLKPAKEYLSSGQCPSPGAVSASLEPYRKAPESAQKEFFGPKYVSLKMGHSLIQIKGNALLAHAPKDRTGYGPIGAPRLNWFLSGLRSLLSKVRVPDAQFLLYLGDSCAAYHMRVSVKAGVDDRTLKSYSFVTDMGSKMLAPLVLCADRNESDGWGTWGPSRSMSEMYIRHGADHMRQVAANSTRLVPWEKKLNMAVWRGGTTGRGYTPEKWRDEARTKVCNFSQLHPELLDASFTGFPQSPPAVIKELKKANLSLGWDGRLSYEQQWKFKILIVVDGNSVADRLLEQMASNCVVVKQESDWKEHWSEELIPMKHYIPVKYDLSDLGDVLRRTLADDKLMRYIAEESTKFALEKLDPLRRVECYWFELITSVAQLSKTPVRQNDKVDVICPQTSECSCPQSNYCVCKSLK